MGESGSEFLTSFQNLEFLEVTIFSANVRKPCLKATFKDNNNLIKNNNFLVDEPENVEPVTPCMDVYKENTQYIVSLDKSKLIIMVREYIQNKDLIEDTYSPKSSMRNLKYFLADAVKNKEIVHQLNFIGAFLKAKVKIGYL